MRKRININNKINIIKIKMMNISKINKMKIMMTEELIMKIENNCKILTLMMMNITEVLVNLELQERNNKCLNQKE